MSVRTWVEQWPVYRQVTGDDRLGLGAASRSRTTAAAAPADRHRRPGGQVGLPVLRGRLRARTSTSRTTRSSRSRATRDSPDQPRPAVPEGLGHACSSPPAPQRRHQVLYRRPYGTDWEELDLRHGDGHGRRPGRRRPARETWRVGGRRQADPPHAGHRQPRRRDAGQRGELPHQEAASPRWASSRSRTRPAYDTPPPSPVWGPRSAAAARRRSSRTCRTPTASSSRARTWPSATRSGSSG